MKKLQSFLLFFFIFLLIFFLSACSSKESTTTSQDESSKTEAGASQDASQLTGLWRAEKAFELNFQTQKLEERGIMPLDAVEFKDGQVCIMASGSANAYGTGKFWLNCGEHTNPTLRAGIR